MTFSATDTMDSYVDKHLKLRNKMIVASFLKISLEATTIDFMIDGLNRNPTTRQTAKLLEVSPQPQLKCSELQLIVLLSMRMTSLRLELCQLQ